MIIAKNGTQYNNLNGINIRIATGSYKMIIAAPVSFVNCGVLFITSNLEFRTGDAYFSADNCMFMANGDLNITDNAGSSSLRYLFIFVNSNVVLGIVDTWTINTSRKIGFALGYGTSCSCDTLAISGSVGQYLFNFTNHALLFTKGCNFNGLPVISIAQNQLTAQGIWFNRA